MIESWILRRSIDASNPNRAREGELVIGSLTRCLILAGRNCVTLRAQRRTKLSFNDWHCDRRGSTTGVKQFIAGAQLIVEKISQGFDPGNAFESGVAQYPKVGVELIGGFG